MVHRTPSQFVAKIATFTALTVVLDAIIIPQFSSGVWFGLVYLIVPLAGILLGPSTGFLSTLIGVLVGHTISPRGLEEFIFTLGAPLGALMSGFLFNKRWPIVVGYYTLLLVTYFLTPEAQLLPLAGMWDVYAAYITLIIIAGLSYGIPQLWTNNWIQYTACAFIGLEADVLFRIFLFIPGRTYQSIYGLPLDILPGIWVAGALITPIKVGLATFLTTVIGPRLTTFQWFSAESPQIQ